MRIARFSLNGEPKFGIVDGPELVVLNGHPLVAGYDTTGERVPIKEVKLLAPTIPSKVVCVGLNYADHVAEIKDASAAAEPTLFLKPSSSIVGPGDAIVLPAQSEKVDLEVELTIVMGQIAKNVSEKDALNYVWGFTIANDVTARDLQFSDQQWARSKSFDSFCPIGPWIETEFVPAGQGITATLNGEVKQSSNLSEMIFKIPQIIEFVTNVMTLLPGDVILTGTPAGISAMPAGSTISVSIDGLGTLTNKVSSRVQ